MLNAPNTPRWRAWLLVVVACWAGVAPAFALTFTPGFSFCGPETRVWNFFQNYGGNASDEGSQVADSHQEKVGYGYELASGVHVYLYANANPVGRFDPSGRFSLAELAMASGVGGILGGIAVPVANYAVGRATTITDIVKGAAVGALLGPIALLSPAAGLVIAGGGVISSSALTVEVFLNEHSTPGQKLAASALLIASIAGGAKAMEYAQPAPITQFKLLGDGSVTSFVNFMRANGIEVVAQEVYVRSPFYSVGRRYDVVIRNPETGELTGIEIKATPREFGKHNTAQFAADRFVNESGGEAFGSAAQAANIDGQVINSTYKIMWSQP